MPGAGIVRQDGHMDQTLRGLVVCLPDASLDDYVGAVEVLAQEGFGAVALPVGAEAYADVVAIFGARLRVGAMRVATPEQVHRAADLGATFVFGDDADPALADAANDRGLESYLPAMTPTEVRAVLALPVAGALLFPADVVGHAMANRLGQLGLCDRVIPVGGVGAFAAGEWHKAGSPAVGVDTALLGDALTGGSLSQLRDRTGSFRSVDKRMVEQ